MTDVNRFLSANAPVINAGAMAANINWNNMKAWCGIVGP